MRIIIIILSTFLIIYLFAIGLSYVSPILGVVLVAFVVFSYINETTEANNKMNSIKSLLKNDIKLIEDAKNNWEIIEDVKLDFLKSRLAIFKRGNLTLSFSPNQSIWILEQSILGKTYNVNTFQSPLNEDSLIDIELNTI